MSEGTLMTKRRIIAPIRARRKANKDVAAVIREWEHQHPDVSLVLEIARTARGSELIAEPVYYEMTSDYALTPTVSQVPVLS